MHSYVKTVPQIPGITELKTSISDSSEVDNQPIEEVIEVLLENHNLAIDASSNSLKDEVYYCYVLASYGHKQVEN